MEAGDNQTAVRVSGLRKRFGAQIVLDGIEFEVERGQTVAVLGRTGTGKSVLLKLLIGLQKPDTGTIEMLGEEVTRLPTDQLNRMRKKVGFLFQSSALYDSLTVEENVAFPLRHHTEMNDADRHERVCELLSRVGMEGDGKKLPADISGGMKKRVGLARALALDPEMMLLDEPTAALDPITTAEIIDLIISLREERRITSIMVTHDIRSVEALADHIALLDRGDIKAEGTLEEVKRSGDQFVREFLKQT